MKRPATCVDARVAPLQVTVLLAAACTAAGLRLWDLATLPVFIDEDRYSYVALEMTRLPWLEAVLRPMNFLATGISRAPLVLIIQAALVPLAPDPVVAGRWISIASSLLTTLLCFVAGRRLGGPAVGLITGWLYALAPLAILHEQMALQDGPLTTAALATTLVSIKAVSTRSWTASALACLLGSIAVQIKVPGLALALLPPFLLVLYPGPRSRLRQALLITLGPLVTYVMLILGPLGASFAEEESRLHIIQPLKMLPHNLTQAGDTITSYLSVGILILAVIGAILAARAAPRHAATYAFVVLVFIVPWLLLSTWTPSRYFLPGLPFVLAFAALACVRIPQLLSARNQLAGDLASGLCAISLVWQGFQGLQLVMDRRGAHLSELDDFQYRSNWPSGYGYSEAAAFVRSSIEPGAAVAYIVAPEHRMASGLHSPHPAGVRSLGLFQPKDPLPIGLVSVLYVVVDDPRNVDDPGATPIGKQLQEVLSKMPTLQVVKQFPRPGISEKVTILRWDRFAQGGQ
jgi:dolichyl-phosphate-mannose-protein mannosyltransferase